MGLEPHEHIYAQSTTPLLLPGCRLLLILLNQGVMELGDADDPLNAWYFGAKDELFAYRLMGQHATMSGIRMKMLHGRCCSKTGTDALLPVYVCCYERSGRGV